ncbi:adhesion G-protein coupled receptor G5-like isoform X3 [Onychostoma macrolepis]|uniref:adhesion G-protein coupled receptor G5-like isoform X3 n=1 Tax=Onychostoma macrolepis TaxID=369639 RepID=UPI00272A8B6D|nr:adhesion G-protein coupled receptor G5-like isoform X3 [Onychostoma macrolepis]
MYVYFTIFCSAMENDRDFKMCGTWRHGNASRNLKSDLKAGCKEIEISANESTLSIQGSITAKCTRSSSIPLESNPLQNQSHFCVFWEPLLDLMIVEVNGKKYTLCESHGLQGTCCTDLSLEDQKTATLYGIENGSIHGDTISYNVMELYRFRGDTINCKEKFCDEASQKRSGANMIEEVVMKSNKTGRVDLPCAQSTIIEIKEGFTGLNFTLPAPRTVAPNMTPTVYLPSCLKSQSRITSKVVCTYYKDKSLFQRGSSDAVLLDDIVGLSVENEIIKNLPEPVRIRFHHSALPPNLSRRCVSWDTRRDNEVKWRYDGCETVKIHDTETECCCNHLRYFAILVQVEQKATVRHLEALTFITAVGCAVSLVSCLVLFYWLCKRRCWMLDSDNSRLAHYIIIIGLLSVVVSSGIVMLFFVATKIRNRPEWRKNRMVFFSIWGLTCLFGTTWGLGLFSFGPLSEARFCLFCIINSCFGVFHMLRYYALEQMKKRCELSLDGGSGGSVMLQCRDEESVL